MPKTSAKASDPAKFLYNWPYPTAIKNSVKNSGLGSRSCSPPKSNQLLIIIYRYPRIYHKFVVILRTNKMKNRNTARENADLARVKYPKS